MIDTICLNLLITFNLNKHHLKKMCLMMTCQNHFICEQTIFFLAGYFVARFILRHGVISCGIFRLFNYNHLLADCFGYQEMSHFASLQLEAIYTVSLKRSCMIVTMVQSYDML